MTDIKIVTTKEAAEILSISVSFLEQDRHRQTGYVPFIRLGRSVRYKLSDLERILENGTESAEPAEA